MSQVIIVQDSLSKKRSASKIQEDAIDCNTYTKRWHLSNVHRQDFVYRLLGLVALPVFVIWSLLALFIALALGTILITFKILSSFFRRSPNIR